MNSVVLLVLFVLLTVGLVFTLIRLVRGPSLPDRVVALDLLGFVILGFIAANVLRSGEIIYLDVLMVVAIVLFLGTIAFAKYLERRRD
jgi:multicomponent Na+:H+ antiporter subunit F